MFKLSSTTYNIRHYNEINRYFDKGANILHILNKNTSNSIGSGIETKYMEIDEEIKNTLKENFYDNNRYRYI